MPLNSNHPAKPLAEPLAWNRYFSFAAIALAGCAADLLTKHWIFAWRGLPPNYLPADQVPAAPHIWWLWEGYVGIETALNTGALFGLGKDMVWLFAGLSVAALVGIGYWLFVAKAAHDLFLTCSLGCITGGILGNLYDRLGLWGGVDIDGASLYAVRDWILLRYGNYTWPNFNVADSLLVCGAGLLILHAFWQRDASDESAKSTKKTAQSSAKS